MATKSNRITLKDIRNGKTFWRVKLTKAQTFAIERLRIHGRPLHTAWVANENEKREIMLPVRVTNQIILKQGAPVNLVSTNQLELVNLTQLLRERMKNATQEIFTKKNSALKYLHDLEALC